jgi:hypothetical protein
MPFRQPTASDHRWWAGSRAPRGRRSFAMATTGNASGRGGIHSQILAAVDNMHRPHRVRRAPWGGPSGPVQPGADEPLYAHKETLTRRRGMSKGATHGMRRRHRAFLFISTTGPAEGIEGNLAGLPFRSQ